jgi:hypothetical protein
VRRLAPGTPRDVDVTERSTNHWLKLDDLLRELGAVRVEADDAKRQLTDDAIRERIERVLREAATAVDDTIDQVANWECLISAWEQLVVAHDTIAAIRARTRESGEMIRASVELRKRAESLMRESEEKARMARALMDKRLGRRED